MDIINDLEGKKPKTTWTLRASTDYGDLPKNTEIRRQIILTYADKTEAYNTAGKIHAQLAGNKDYVESRIVLNLDYRTEDGLYMVFYAVMADSESDPKIELDF
ncbi:MAG: hypothetical protein K2F99_08025 [Muribaculaceae bacterium]|nr:hypothetical protein [Muribaculaceae bacterium]